ncbi:MAG: hypothetical protein C4525_07310 [Desulfarculus sp.]|jgi:hypothetical protein|nr:MAG: hypothetical protein C4525_07310 [Desulfarculus sp.]
MKKLFLIAVAVLAIVAMSVPALAAAPSPSFTLGARMLTDIGWWQRSQELTSNKKDDVGTWFINMPGHSYLLARFYSADKTMGGRVEFGIKSLNGATAVDMRYLYGWWRIGNCRILAGHTDNWFGSLAYHPKQYVGLNENAHLLLFGWGFLWPHRVPQVQFTYNTASWGVQFALEEPRSRAAWTGATGVDAYFTFPRASLTFMFKAGSFMTHPGVSYVQRQYKVATGSDESNSTWAVVLPVKFTAGAFTLKFQGHYGINFGGEYPFYPTTTGGADTRPLLVGSSVKDTTILGGMIAGEFTVGKLMITGGFGYERFQNDDGWVAANGYSKDENVRWAAFIAFPYQVAKNLNIQPEFSYYNWGDAPATGSDLGTEWILGVQFHFVF